MNMIATALLLLVSFPQDHAGTKPAPRGKGWIKRHEGFVKIAKKGDVDLLFLGDSITDAWRKGGRKIFDEEFCPMKAANFGISGDCTQHVLWRLRNGEFDDLKPKVVMLLIGTNNFGWNKQGAESTIAGIKAVVAEIHKRSPKTKVLLLAIFPRAENPDHPHRALIKKINVAVSKLDDGGKTVQVLDLADKFLQANGKLTKDVMPDFLHLTPKGYRIWADAVKGPIKKLMGGK